jgi:small subunit ribosomal protein S2
MRPYIYGRRSLIHIIDLRQTVRGLLRATHFLSGLTATGAPILFVGTKKQIKSVVEEQARRCQMPFVVERWIGGTLTNYKVIRPRLDRLRELEAIDEGSNASLYNKKTLSGLRRQRRKLTRNLDGIRTMEGLPGAIVVVDPRREEIAVKEAHRMGIPTVCVLDTDCDPDLADIAIPANDDAMKSVSLLLSKLADAVVEGRANYDATAMIGEKQRESEAASEPRPTRSRRPSDRPMPPRMRRGPDRPGPGGGGASSNGPAAGSPDRVGPDRPGERAAGPGAPANVPAGAKGEKSSPAASEASPG